MKTTNLAGMRRLLNDFTREHRAAAAIEYALIAGGIALAIVTVVAALGVNVTGLYQSVATGLGGLVN